MLVLLAVALFPHLLYAQSVPDKPDWNRRNSFGIFGEYSNDSSHILLGHAPIRGQGAIFFTYFLAITASTIASTTARSALLCGE